MGFGNEKALKCIMDNMDLLDVQAANHIRLSVVIIDNQILIYVPSALAWEDETKDSTFPNGLLGGVVLADKMLEQLNFTKKQLSFDDNLIEQI